MIKETLEEKTYRLFTKSAVDAGIRLEAIPPIHMYIGTPSFVVLTDILELGIAEEREACAKTCENIDAYEAYEPEVRQECADAIRARSEL